MKHPPPPPSKLFIRSEVLAVIEYLSIVENPPKQDKLKQIKRLNTLEAKDTVLEILVKELQRSTKAREVQTISELMMEIGTIDLLQDPLWRIIRSNSSTDEIKDAANLILHHLGDESDPDLYLEYLEDPQGLINRETERMLEVSAGNPEALIDFIDFIFSLPVEEQCNLLNSLQADYQPDYLVNIYIPTLWADPPPPVRDQILKNLGNTRIKRAALALEEMAELYQDNEESLKIIKRSINELKLAGIYRPELFEEYREELKAPHQIVSKSNVHQCYATLPDGIGNQGIIVSRQKENGDIVMMSVATNDIHGIIDCFGFYQLSETDFNRIIEKFHEESCKIMVPPQYCHQKLLAAEALNRQNHFRLPYEYTCWKVLLDDSTENSPDLPALCEAWATPQWAQECGNLYQHPDFSTWFLERGDHPAMADLLDEVQPALDKTVKAKETEISGFIQSLESIGYRIVTGLMDSSWREDMIQRLEDAAYLLHCQNTQTFSKLAATEALKLQNYKPGSSQDKDDPLKHGFIRQYGRRCIEEELLRLKQLAEADTIKIVDTVLETWEV